MPSVSFGALALTDQTLEEAFPEVPPNCEPLGSKVLVQIMTPKNKTKGGILLTDETRQTIAWNTQVAKVIGLGPVAFRNRQTLDLWPEGKWCGPGEFVRVPKYGGDRFEVPVGEGLEDVALFAMFNDLDLSGRVPDPLSVIAFI